MLLSTAVVNLDAMRQGAELREGVLRLESLLRFAQAEAALRGQRIRVELQARPAEDPLEPDEPATEPVRLTVESDPLGSPGEFTVLPSTSWGNRRLGELIQLELVLGGERSPAAATAVAGSLRDEGVAGGAGPTGRMVMVAFDPEGGASEARLVVCSADVKDARRMLVVVDGLTGHVSHRELTEEALESLQSEADREDPGDEEPVESAGAAVGGYAP